MSESKGGVIPESHRDILEKKAFAHVATIGPRGEPQVSPVWFDWDGTHVRLSLVPQRQRFKNLERDPRVALAISDPDDPYRNLELRGAVVRVERDADRSFVDGLTKKYIGQEKYPWDPPGAERFILVVEPRHATAFP
jgi:PPOX class probable F420-dependent enzyme